MGNSIKYSSNTNSITISSGNPMLNGTGNIATLLTASNMGTMVNSITIKAINPTTQGMIRLFLNNGGSSFLYQEIMVPAVSPTGDVQTFSAIIYPWLNLQAGYSLGVTTQNSEAFGITAVGVDYSYCSCP